MPAGPEREFQNTLVSLLEMFGYVTEHTYPLLTKQGFWRTGSTLKGKPDLIALRPPRLLAIEVKGPTGRLEPAQRAVLSIYAAVPSARAWVVTPTDPPWADVQAWVRRPKDAPAAWGFDPLPFVEARALLDKVQRERKPRSKRGSRGAQPSLPLDQ